jgi:predicted aspartyl protease
MEKFEIRDVTIVTAIAVALTIIAVIVGFSGSSSSVIAEDQSRDAIPFRSVNGAMYVYASLGGVPHNMILDTGASSSLVTVPIANALLRRRQADIVPGIFMTGIANGAAVPNQKIVVHNMSIGRHRLHNVEMLVQDDGAPVLLGLSELNAIGSFTIDSARHQIRFD